MPVCATKTKAEKLKQRFLSLHLLLFASRLFAAAVPRCILASRLASSPRCWRSDVFARHPFAFGNGVGTSYTRTTGIRYDASHRRVHALCCIGKRARFVHVWAARRRNYPYVENSTGPSSASATPLPLSGINNSTRSTTPPYPPPAGPPRFPALPPQQPYFSQQQSFQSQPQPSGPLSNFAGVAAPLPQDQLASLLALTAGGSGQNLSQP